MHYIVTEKALVEKALVASEEGQVQMGKLQQVLGISAGRMVPRGKETLFVSKIFIPQGETPQIPGLEKTGKVHHETGTIFDEWSPKDSIQGKEAQKYLEQFGYPNPAFAIMTTAGWPIPEEGNIVCYIPPSPDGTHPSVCLKTVECELSLQTNDYPGLKPLWEFGKDEGSENFLQAWKRADEDFKVQRTTEDAIFEATARDLWAVLESDPSEGEDQTQTMKVGGDPLYLSYVLQSIQKHLSKTGWMVIEEAESYFEVVR